MTGIQQIVIAGAVRTAQGKLGGALSKFTNHELGKAVVHGLLEKTALQTEAVDEVIFGCVGQPSDAANVARVISLMSGLHPTIPAFTVNRNCASGLQAIVSACQMIKSGESELIIAGGVEVMSAYPFINRDLRFGKHLRHSAMIDSLWEGLTDPMTGLMMGQTAEYLAREFQIGRCEQDEYALLSHQRAFAAEREGKFDQEIIPVKIQKKMIRGDDKMENFHRDECINPHLSMPMMSQYPPVFEKDGTVTSGNSCPISDGASAVIVTTEKRAKQFELEVWGSIKGYDFTGVDPRKMGLGPAESIPKILEKLKLNLTDIDLFEINEAFAAQYLTIERVLQLDRCKVNVNGGAIALGHPVGATGCRQVVTLLHEMKRSNQPLGLVSMCVGGGQGGTIVLERR